VYTGDAQKETEMKNLITCLVVCVLSGFTFATTWTVDDDGKADFDNIQAAIDAASDGDEIVVMPGTYTGTGYEVVHIDLGKGVWLHSSKGAEVTIIDGEGTRRGFYCENSNTTIEGFTITNGYAEYGGGGISIHFSSPTVENCVITYNYANNFGGGLLGYGASPTVTNCTFEYNTAKNQGGGMCFDDSYPTNATLTNCTFTNNTAFNGGGMYASSGSLTLTNCVFSNNESYDGGGIYTVGGYLTNCTFENNHSTWGGGATLKGTTSVTNCIFANNTGLQLGGGLICHGNDVVINKCVVQENQSGNGGGIFTENVTGPLISNSIVCGNVDSQIIGSYVDLGGNVITETCSENLGTCCTNDICVDGEEELCNTYGGQWLGFGSTCAENPCPTSCLGDITGDGVVDVSDLLVVIGVWGTCP